MSIFSTENTSNTAAKQLPLKSENNTENGTENPTVNTNAQQSVNNTQNNHSSSGLNDFLNHINNPRPEPQERPNTNNQETKETEEPADKIEDEETSELFELTKEDCRGLAEFIVEMEDITLPEIAGYLNKTNADQYRAKPRHKEALINAWAVYLYDTQIHMTPFQRLMVAHLVAYGSPIGFGLYKLLKPIILNYINKLRQKSKEAEEKNTEEADFEEVKTTEKEQPKKSEEKTVEKPDAILKECAASKCHVKFDLKNGYAKNPDSKYYQKFCSRTCMNRTIAKQRKNG